MGFTKFVATRLLKRDLKYVSNRTLSKALRKPPWKVLFFGSDAFSLFSLEALTQEYRKGSLISNLEIVTSIKGKPNAVRLYSEKENLHMHKWPPNLVYGQFDVGLVVSFGHLIPRDIIEQFEFGMLNVHASLLPRWRGAAPIIYAIANGDAVTGISIMKISPEKFDVGEILFQESVEIPECMKMKDLHTLLGKVGAKTLMKTLESLPDCLKSAKPQPSKGVTYAPKVTSDLAWVKWDTMTSSQILNLARALDGIFNLQSTWNGIPIKLFNINIEQNCEIGCDSNMRPGFVKYDKCKNLLKVLCSDNRFITVEKIGVQGKRLMNARDFNNGYVKKEPPDCRYFK